MDQKNKQLMIFLAGELRYPQKIRSLIQNSNFDFAAADGGYLYAGEFALELKWLIGDFDSAPQPENQNVLVFPSEKDETDSELALLLAEKEGYKEVWMIAPFGGRIDHTFANLCLLDSASKKGINLRLYDGENLASLIGPGEHRLRKGYRYYSFFPWGDQAVLSLKGFKYNLDRYTLLKSVPIAISNEDDAGEPVVHVHNGSVLCICIENNQEVL